MEHSIKLSTEEYMVIVDALDIMKQDEEINPEDRVKARRLSNLIIDIVFKEIKGKGKDGSKNIS